ncbi:MAG: PASTA domain-containing protein [bacterium]
MKIFKILNQIWFIPFGSFIFGYYLFSYFYPDQDIIVPNITGKNLQDSIRILTDANLSLYFLKELENPDLPEGVILNQSPYANQKVKKHQNIFVTISKKPKILNTPNFFEQKQSQISKYLEDLGIVGEFFWIDSFYPLNSCIAQSSEQNTMLNNEKLLIYLSAGENNFYIVPLFKGCKIKKMYDSLALDKIKLDIFHRNKKVDNYLDFENYIIVDQKPMAGSIVDLDKKLYLQIQIEE